MNTILPKDIPSFWWWWWRALHYSELYGTLHIHRKGNWRNSWFSSHRLKEETMMTFVLKVSNTDICFSRVQHFLLLYDVQKTADWSQWGQYWSSFHDRNWFLPNSVPIFFILLQCYASLLFQATDTYLIVWHGQTNTQMRMSLEPLTSFLISKQLYQFEPLDATGSI